jgi:hypothetical protein
MASQPQQVEIPMSLKMATGIRLFYYLQLFVTPPYPRHSFAKSKSSLSPALTQALVLKQRATSTV